MKLNMKHSVLPRLLALVFALTLLLTAAVTPASAAERDYTRWEYDPASDTLTATFSDGDTEVYVRYGEPSRLRFLPLDDFIYKNTVKIGDVTYRVHAPRLGAETVVLTDPNDGYRIYVTRSQEKSLDTLLGLENLAPALTYFEYGKLKYADMSKGFMRDLRKLKTDGETLRGSLHEFRYAPRYELWGYDDDEYLSANLGMLFDLAGEMYYLDVLELPDSAFDESGALLPSESLTVTLLANGEPYMVEAEATEPAEPTEETEPTEGAEAPEESEKGGTVAKTVTLTAENDWTATVTGLLKYENGVEIRYSWDFWQLQAMHWLWMLQLPNSLA